jgi:hypothetical protein
MKTMLGLAALAALSLAACSGEERTTGTAPQGSDVAAAMPDTATPRAPNDHLTAPDAGATGTVPADGSAPAVAATPPVGTAGGSPGVPGASERPVAPGKE